MTHRRSLLLLLFAVSATCFPFAAAAQPRSPLEEGVRLYGHGEYLKSLEVLERAARRSIDPKELGQIYLHLGFDRAILGDQEGAERDLVAALGYDPDLEPDPHRFKQELLDLFRRVRARLGLLEVTANRKGATLALDAPGCRALPARLRLPAGSHRLEARLGSQVQGRTVSLTAGQSLQVDFVFSEPTSRPSAATSPPGGLAGAGPGGKAPSFWQRRRVWTWVAAGSTAAVGIAATGCGSYAWYLDRHLQTTQDEARRNSIQLTANILYGVTGALAVTSVVLLFLEGRPSTDSAASHSSSSVSLVPLFGGAGAALTGRFE
jgi:hypothetical protein